MIVIYAFLGCSENTKLANNASFDSGLLGDSITEGNPYETTIMHLLSVDTTLGDVVRIDPRDGTTNAIGSVSLEYEINTMDTNENGVTYVYEHLGRQIAIFDPCTGELKPLPVANQDSVICGISFAPNGTLYALDSNLDLLMEYNIETGEIASVGSLDMDIRSCGLAYDSNSDRLIGATASTGEVFNIDLSTGNTFNHISTDVPFSGVGIEFDAETGQILASTGTELYSIDPNNGASTLLGSLTGHIDDLVYHPECQ